MTPILKELDEANLLCELQASRISGLETFKKQYDALSINRKQLSEGLLEKLAELEHEQWIKWSQSIASEIQTLFDMEHFSGSLPARWKKCWVPYSELTEEQKEHDRKWARKVLKVFGEAFSQKGSLEGSKEPLNLALAFADVKMKKKDSGSETK